MTVTRAAAERHATPHAEALLESTRVGLVGQACGQKNNNIYIHGNRYTGAVFSQAIEFSSREHNGVQDVVVAVVFLKSCCGARCCLKCATLLALTLSSAARSIVGTRTRTRTDSGVGFGAATTPPSAVWQWPPRDPICIRRMLVHFHRHRVSKPLPLIALASDVSVNSK